MKVRSASFFCGEYRMKQTLRKELVNILFLILIVAAAVIIYLLSRGEANSTQTASRIKDSSENMQKAKKVTPEPIEKQAGVPEAVFETFLASSDVISAEARNRTENLYVITYDDASQLQGTLLYELREGCISSVEISFPLPVKFKTSQFRYPKALIYSANKALERALPKGLPEVLCEVFPAACEDDELQQSSVRFWAEKALVLKSVGAKFEDKESGYRFLAYRSQEGSAQKLVCVLFLD